MIFSTPSNYFLSSYALTLTLNAMSLNDYMQASVASGARIMAYMKMDKIENPNSDAAITAENALIDILNIDLGYDVDLNYRAWSINLVPTYFTSTSAKYIYAAIPRGSSNITTAMIVFPSNKIDIFGRMQQTFIENNQEVTKVVQIGSSDYYYIWLYGEISASVDESGASQNRSFIVDESNKILSPYNSGALDTKKSQTEGMVDDLTTKFLNKTKDDSTPYSLGIGKDLNVGRNETIFGDSTIKGKSTVEGDSIVKGKQTVIGTSEIGGDITVHGNQTIDADSTVNGKQSILGSNEIGEDSIVHGNQVIDGSNTVNGRSTLKDDLTVGQYTSGIGGSGSKIDKYGNAEMRGLTLWETLQVPKLSFNRVEVLVGLDFQSSGGGTIKSVVIDKDVNGNELASGTIKLDLKDGEYGAVEVGDLCMGIFHNFGGTNDTANYDSHTGNIQKMGFRTSFFCITEITDTATNGEFKYILREVSDSWTQLNHPSPQMDFAQRGSTTNTSRQNFKYRTTEYSIGLTGVNTWEFSDSNIYYIEGKLDGWTVGDKTFDGYGVVYGNAYIYGKIDQFEKIGYLMTFDGQGDYFIADGETKQISAIIKDGYGGDVTNLFTGWTIARNTGNTASDNIWNAQAIISNGVFNVTWSNSKDDLGGNNLALFTVVAHKRTQSVIGTLQI